jgi:BirA family biotin operon repressor/biotin-[acetyl-CoA-carboxylase] ligase
VVLGIGVNVNQCAADFPKELRETATSLAMECGGPVSRVDVLRAFLHRFEADYFTFLRGGLGPLESSLRRHSALLGRRIRVETGTQEFCGEALDLDPLGRLVVRVEGGGIRTLSSGEVRLVR